MPECTPGTDGVSAVYDTHNTFAEGGKKIHVLNYRTGRCLCGYGISLCNEADLSYYGESLAAYLSQPDPDHNICLRCKQIFFKHTQSQRQ